MGRTGPTTTKRKCYQCGEIFPVEDAKMYAYKEKYHSRTVYFCVWSCLCEFRRQHEKTVKLKGGAKYAV